MKKNIKKILTFKVLIIILLTIGVICLIEISNDLKDLKIIKSNIRGLDRNLELIKIDLRDIESKVNPGISF